MKGGSMNVIGLDAGVNNMILYSFLKGIKKTPEECKKSIIKAAREAIFIKRSVSMGDIPLKIVFHNEKEVVVRFNPSCEEQDECKMRDSDFCKKKCVKR